LLHADGWVSGGWRRRRCSCCRRCPLPVTFSSAWKQYDLGERPEEFLTRTYQALSDAKRAITHHPESLAV
jgi:hypothetical protein